MADTQKRNFRIKAALARDFDEFIQNVRDAGADVKPGQVISGALLLFLEQDTEQQLRLIERARNYDLEKLCETQAAARVVADARQQADQQERQGKPARKRAADR